MEQKQKLQKISQNTSCLSKDIVRDLLRSKHPIDRVIGFELVISQYKNVEKINEFLYGLNAGISYGVIGDGWHGYVGVYNSQITWLR